MVLGVQQVVGYLALWALCALSKPTEKKDRVQHDPQLSNKVHDDAQNFDYDHDAFLGADEAKTFDQLTPEESKERLGWWIAKRCVLEGCCLRRLAKDAVCQYGWMPRGRNVPKRVAYKICNGCIPHPPGECLVDCTKPPPLSLRGGLGQLNWPCGARPSGPAALLFPSSPLALRASPPPAHAFSRSYLFFCIPHRKIVSKIDEDKDGLVTVEELKAWIKFAQKRWIYEDVERQRKGHDLNGDGLISWEEYKNATYGYVLDDPDPDDGFNYKQMMVRDERRFKMADKDGDLIATKEEFTAFLHPEEYDYMKDIVVQETMEDIDKNGDGFINLEEYIGDMYSHDGDTEEPEWVKTEREQFVEFRDKNHDGKMDKEETKDWILPSDYDHAEAEARHLVYESDQDKDGKLTKEEIVDKYDLFVGSQATDFGEALVRHDEF